MLIALRLHPCLRQAQHICDLRVDVFFLALVEIETFPVLSTQPSKPLVCACVAASAMLETPRMSNRNKV